MRRKVIVSVIISCTLIMSGCEASDTIEENETETLYEEKDLATEETSDTEEVESEAITDWSEYYQNILATNTSEAVNQVITGDFKGNGMTQAFIITTPQPLNLEEISDIEGYFCVSSLWYLDGEMCQNLYLDSDKYSVICESGYIQNKMIIAIGTLSAWAPEQNYNSTIWYVSEGSPKSAGEMECVTGIEEGYLVTFQKTYGEDEEGEYRALFEYSRYSFDDGTISYVDSYVE